MRSSTSYLKSGLGEFFLVSVLLALSPSVSLAMTNYSHVQGLIDEAKAFRLSGSYDNAEAKLLRAQRIAPRSADVYLELAYLRKDQGNFDDLQNIVGVGSDIADGPEVSLAHLKALKTQLAIALPVSPSQSFSTPPIVALERVSPIMKRSDDAVEPIKSEVRSASIGPPEAIEKIEFSENDSLGLGRIEEEVASANEVSEDSSPTTVLEPSEAVPSLAVESVALGANPDNSVVEPNPSREALASVETQPPIVTEPAQQTSLALIKPPLNESPKSISVVSTASDPLAEKTIDRVVINRPNQPGMKRTALAGLGILDKPRSGTWMSQGVVEVDF